MKRRCVICDERVGEDAIYILADSKLKFGYICDDCAGIVVKEFVEKKSSPNKRSANKEGKCTNSQ